MDTQNLRRALNVVSAFVETLCASGACALLAVSACRYLIGVSDTKVLGTIGLLIFFVVWRIVLQFHPRFE